MAVPGAVRGALWMVAADLAFVGVMASAKALFASMPAIEIVFFRAALGLFIVGPVMLHAGRAAMRTERLRLHGLRALFAVGAMGAAYYALGHVPVATVTALSFLIPVFATALAPLALGERADGVRWLATATGFAGALVILRPGFVAVTAPMLAMLASSLLYAGTWLSLKALTRTESASATVFYFNVLILPMTLAPSLFVWRTPGLADLPALAALGLCGWAAHFAQARAFASAEATAVLPYDFLRLPFAVAVGYALFGDATDLWTWIGASIIFAAAYAITLREARRERSGPR